MGVNSVKSTVITTNHQSRKHKNMFSAFAGVFPLVASKLITQLPNLIRENTACRQSRTFPVLLATAEQHAQAACSRHYIFSSESHAQEYGPAWRHVERSRLPTTPAVFIGFFLRKCPILGLGTAVRTGYAVHSHWGRGGAGVRDLTTTPTPTKPPCSRAIQKRRKTIGTKQQRSIWSLHGLFMLGHTKRRSQSRCHCGSQTFALVFQPSATKSGRPHGVMYMSLWWTPIPLLG